MVAIQTQVPGQPDPATGGAGIPDASSQDAGQRGVRIRTILESPEAKDLGLENPVQFAVKMPGDVPPGITPESTDEEIIAALSTQNALTDPQKQFIESHFSKEDQAVIYHQIADGVRYRIVNPEVAKAGHATPEQAKILAHMLGYHLARTVPSDGLPKQIPPPEGSLAVLDRLAADGFKPSGDDVVKVAQKLGVDPEQFADDILRAAAGTNGQLSDPQVTGVEADGTDPNAHVHGGEADVGQRGIRIRTTLESPAAHELGLEKPAIFGADAAKKLPPNITSESSDEDILAALSQSGALTDQQKEFIKTNFSPSDQTVIYHQMADGVRVAIATQQASASGGKVTPAQAQVIANSLGFELAGKVPSEGLPKEFPPPGGSLAAIGRLHDAGFDIGPDQIKALAASLGMEPEQLADAVLRSAMATNGLLDDPQITGLKTPVTQPASSTSGPGTPDPGDADKHRDAGTGYPSDHAHPHCSFSFHKTVTRPDGTKEEIDISFDPAHGDSIGWKLPIPTWWGHHAHHRH